MTKEEIHDFNSDFISRYKYLLSAGRDLRATHFLELDFFENGSIFFYLDKEYKSTDKQHTLILETRDECGMVGKIDGVRYEFEYGANLRFIEDKDEKKVEHLFKDGVEFIAV